MNKLFGLFLSLVIAIAPVNVGMATLVSLPSPISYPGFVGALSAQPAINVSFAALSSAGHYTSLVLEAKENMVISHVGFRTGTAGGSPTVEVRIETVDASTGLPSGTLWATNTNGTTGTVSSNTNPLQALTASATISRGQFFAVKIALASGTSLSIAALNVPFPNSNLPYVVTNTGTPTKAVSGTSLIVLGSSSTTFYQIPGAIGASAVAQNAFNNTSSAKRGLLFTPPMNCRIIGIRFYNQQAVGDYNAAVFDSSGSVVGSSSVAVDGDYTVSTATGGSQTVYFTTPVTATAGTPYRVAIEPTTTTNTQIWTTTLVSPDYFGTSPGGANAVYTTFASGAWTDSTTQVPLMDVLIDQVDNGAGTGGGGGRIIGG